MTAARFLVVLDADSTLIRDEVIELLADEAGRRAEVQAATEAAMRGEVDFAASLRSRVHALAGVPTDVSGGFHEILDHIAPGLGVDRWRANRLTVYADRLSGVVDGEIVDAAVKAASLREWARELQLPQHATIAIGDGANDLEMMAAAGLGLAFNAKPMVRRSANLVIGPQDLRAVIPLLP